MEAAPPAPARPEPIMITVYFRLLAGFTSFMSKRCLSHFFSIGPDGTLESSFTGSPQDPELHRQRKGNVAEDDDGREDPRSDLRHGDVARVRDAQGLEHAPEPVAHVQAEEEHRDDVGHRDRDA